MGQILSFIFRRESPVESHMRTLGIKSLGNILSLRRIYIRRLHSNPSDKEAIINSYNFLCSKCPPLYDSEYLNGIPDYKYYTVVEDVLKRLYGNNIKYNINNRICVYENKNIDEELKERLLKRESLLYDMGSISKIEVKCKFPKKQSGTKSVMQVSSNTMQETNNIMQESSNNTIQESETNNTMQESSNNIMQESITPNIRPIPKQKNKIKKNKPTKKSHISDEKVACSYCNNFIGTRREIILHIKSEHSK